MLKHFTGTHDHRMDDKGRVSMPTEFRRVLTAVGAENALYLVPQLNDPRALFFFTVPGYDKLVERHYETQYPSWAEQQRAEMKLMARALQIQVDDNGRFVVTKPLRDLVGLEKDARFVGSGASFEIWRPDAREAHEAEVLAGEAEAPVRIDIRGLH